MRVDATGPLGYALAPPKVSQKVPDSAVSIASDARLAGHPAGLRRTFAPLGKTVSSLYGSIGASGADIDALRMTDIVVATPEKLDFALRNDPTLLDDVGLVVLDEGHMIGLGEREVGLGEIRIELERSLELLDRRSELAGLRVGDAGHREKSSERNAEKSDHPGLLE